RAGNGRPLQLVGAIRDAVHQADPEQSIGDIVSLEQLIGRQTAVRRFNTTLLTIFALLAVGLALVGIYGVTAYAVTQRTRELGIRMALGARGVDVVGRLMRGSLRRVGVGVGLGLLAALGVTRALSAMLFEVAPRDAVTFAATALLLVAVALVATWVPTRRTTKVDQMVALRYELGLGVRDSGLGGSALERRALGQALALHHPSPEPLAPSPVLPDLRYALRALRRTPTFTATAILILALGIGMASAVFTVIQAVVLRRLPVQDQDRIVELSGVAKCAARECPLARDPFHRL